MKKYLTLTFVLLALAGNAQQTPVLKSKRGINILPQQGEYCLGFGTNQVFSYLGNMFNGNLNNGSPSLTFPGSNGAIFGKYMKTNDYAYRASFVFGLTNTNFKTSTQDLSPGAAADSKVEDVNRFNSSNLNLSFGIEKRKGSTRIQGYYGLEGVLGYYSSSNKYEYGNKIEYFDTGTTRPVKIRSGSRFSIGVRAFAGVEYFIAPKVSLGAEFGYGVTYSFSRATEVTSEIYNFSQGSRLEYISNSGTKSSGFNVGSDNYNGIIKMLFYF